MKTKQEIVDNWLQRYTKMPLDKFGEHILLTNFNNYVDIFCKLTGVEPVGFDANMRAATAGNITSLFFSIIHICVRPERLTYSFPVSTEISHFIL